jgi:hypothetical protein
MLAKMQNLHIHHDLIQLKLKYLIVVKAEKIAKFNLQSGFQPGQNPMVQYLICLGTKRWSPGSGP